MENFDLSNFIVTKSELRTFLNSSIDDKPNKIKIDKIIYDLLTNVNLLLKDKEYIKNNLIIYETKVTGIDLFYGINNKSNDTIIDVSADDLITIKYLLYSFFYRASISVHIHMSDGDYLKPSEIDCKLYITIFLKYSE